MNNELLERYDSEEFFAILNANNAGSAVFLPINVTAVLFDPEAVPEIGGDQPRNVSGADLIATVSGTVFMPKSVDNPVYDDTAGHLKEDSEKTCTWDFENRLLSVESKVARSEGYKVKVENRYDYRGRRILKKVYENGALIRTHYFYYDITLLDGRPSDFGLLTAEIVKDVSDNVIGDYQYLNGLDLNGVYQSLGGVGNLIAAIDKMRGKVYLPCMDAKGTIWAWVDADTKQTVAEITYDPYGRILKKTGSLDLPFKFQSKYYDSEFGLYNFGLRYLQSETCKWLSRDPIEEKGGLNQYAYANGDPISGIEYLGCADLPNHLNIGLDVLDILEISLEGEDLECYMSGLIYPDMPFNVLSADNSIYPKAMPLHIYLQTKEGIEFYREKYSEQIKRAKRVVRLVKSLDDYLVPAAVGEAFESAREVAAVPVARAGYWWNSTGLLGPIMTNTPYVRNWDVTQTHYGRTVYLHAMGKLPMTPEVVLQSLTRDTQDRITEYRQFMTAGKARDAYFALGQAMHYLADSWTPSHTVRDESGRILIFQDYDAQDLNQHKAMDNLAKYSPALYNQAVTQSVLLMLDAQKTGGFDASKYYPLGINPAIGIRKGMEPRSLWYYLWNGTGGQ